MPVHNKVLHATPPPCCYFALISVFCPNMLNEASQGFRGQNKLHSFVIICIPLFVRYVNENPHFVNFKKTHCISVRASKNLPVPDDSLRNLRNHSILLYNPQNVMKGNQTKIGTLCHRFLRWWLKRCLTQHPDWSLTDSMHFTALWYD